LGIEDFTIVRDDCTKATLGIAPKARSRCTISVIFYPQSVATIRSTLTINLGSRSAIVALRGVGVDRGQNRSGP
jgi:hypothetical protein